MLIKKFKDMSISIKIVTITLLITTFVTGTAFIFMILYQYKSMSSELFENISLTAAQTAEYCYAPMKSETADQVIAILAGLKRDEHIIDAHIYTLDTAVYANFASNNYSDKYAKPAILSDTNYIEGEIINIVQMIGKQGKNIGTLHLRASQASVHESSTQNLQIMFLLMGGVILLSYILAGFLQRIITKPILRLVWVANMISDNKDYSVRLEVTGNDEISTLYRGFNNLLEQISLQQNERDKTATDFKSKNNTLESRVILRTAQYENALLKLRTEVDHRKSSEENLLKAKESAEIANKTKSEFLANMSHEVRTPLNAILGFAELLLKATNDPKQKKYLQIILQSGNSLLALINDILDLSKIEAGRLEFKYNYMDFNKNLSEIRSIFSQKIEEKKLSFELIMQDKFPRLLYLDEIRIRQVIFNLIGNAVKFTEKGGIKIEAHYEKDDELYTIYLDIVDTGIGIKPQHQKGIFEAFRQFSADNLNDSNGTGLGLAITKRLVTEMGGSIELESTPDVGTKFSVIFKNIKAHNDPESIKIPEAPNDKYVFDRAVILIADDLLFNRELVKGYLREYNFEFLEASNGIEAVKLALKFKPDIILMDMIMPKSDGAKAIKAIRSNVEVNSIPIIVFTAVHDIDEKIKGLIDGFIRKPISQNDLVTSISKFLKHKTLAPSVDLPHKKLLNKNNVSISINNKLTDTINLAELASILESDFLPRCHKIKHTIIIDDVEDLANDLSGLAVQFGVDYLHDYSKSLLEAADDCNIYKIKSSLDDFEKMYDHLNTLYG